MRQIRKFYGNKKTNYQQTKDAITGTYEPKPAYPAFDPRLSCLLILDLFSIKNANLLVGLHCKYLCFLYDSVTYHSWAFLSRVFAYVRRRIALFCFISAKKIGLC